MLLCTREDTFLPRRHSLEFFFFFFRACMCVSVCMAGLPRAKCILRAAHGGEAGGAPADLQSLGVRDGLFSLRQVRALRSLDDIPPMGTIAGGFVLSVAPRFGLFFPPRGCGK